MKLYQAIVLGLIQGLAEFLPVSSSGHLILFRGFMNLSGEYMLFDVMLHVATLLAIFIVFFKDLLNLFKPPFKTIGLIIIASIPALITGLLLSKYVDEVFAGPKYLCFFFLISALLMFLAEYLSKRTKNPTEIKLKNAVCMGLMQGIAVLPGITRSGSTIFGGVASKGERKAIAKFSFFMSIPIILGAAVLELTDIGGSVSVEWYCYFAGMLTAFISGLAAIKLMMRIIAKANYKWFALYLVIMSVVTFFVYFL